MSNVLLFCTDRNTAIEITDALNTQKHTVVIAAHGVPIHRYAQDNPDIIILDAVFGNAMLSELKKSFPHKPIVSLLPSYDARAAVNLMRLGAYDCICPPLRKVEILAVVNHAARTFGFRDRGTAESIPAIPFGVRPWLYLAGAVFLLSLLWVLFAPARPRVIELPYANPTAIFSDGKEIWISNWYTQSIYRYRETKKTLELVATYFFSDFGPLAIAQSGSVLWSAGNDLVLRRHEMNENMDPAASMQLAEHAPSGMAFVDGTLWLCDAYSKKLYHYSVGAELIPLGVYDCGLDTPVGLSWDGQNLWVGEAKHNKLYVFSPGADRLIQERVYRLPEVRPGFLSGISVSDGMISVLYAGTTSRLYRYRIGELKKDAR